MEEKILIKSEMDKKAKSIFITMIAIFLSLSAILILSLLEEKSVSKYIEYNGFKRAFSKGDGGALAIFIIGCVFFVLGIITLILFLSRRKCELTITEKNVRGKTLYGKEVVLPVYMVSAYSTKSFMSTIAIATSSGSTKFSLIGNYKEIGSVLSQIINDRQESTTTASTTVTKNESPAQSNIDDLVKLKSLLDQGIITQEEFDAKKKEILGL